MADAALWILAGALAIDLLVGELPPALHPVVWIGRLTRLLERLAPSAGALAQLATGALIALCVPALAAFVPALLLAWLPGALAIALAIYLLTASFAIRMLRDSAQTVARALERDDLLAARIGLTALCSRDPRALDAEELAGATTASLAENTCDSIVAPLFYYALFGIPGALAYRAVNTLDAMLGYRHGRYEHLGKAAARLDDLANLVPARLTALLFLVAGWLEGLDVRRGAKILARDRGRTPSPNGGWPMAALAGLLGVALDKPGSYRLGDPLEPATTSTIHRAWRLAGLVALLATLLCAAALAIGAAR